METWIEEFLYRGRPPTGPGSELAPDFHVIVGQQVANPFGGDDPPSRRTVGPLTPTQAAEMGYSLETLVTGINTATLSEVDRLRKIETDLRGELETMQEALEKSKAEFSALENMANKTIEHANVVIAAYEKRVAAYEKQIAEAGPEAAGA